MVKVRLLWPVSHIFTDVCCKFNYFINFNTWKMLKMLKIGCFKQNYCISGMPQGIPMQFFAQQWWKSGYCDQFHTYSQWFAVNSFQKFNSWKMLKMLCCFKQNYCISGMPQGIHAIFCSTVVKVRLLWPVSHIFTVVCCKFYYFQNFKAGKRSKCLK